EPSQARARAGAPPSTMAPGRWVAETTWPPPQVEERRLAWEAAYVDPVRDSTPARLLVTGRAAIEPITHHSEPTIGLAAGPWCQFGIEPESAPDQTRDDARSFRLETAPLDAPLEILGATRVELDLAVDRRAAFLGVRLCDVAPNGDAVRVAYGVLDLELRRSQDERVAIVPGERMHVEMQLRQAAHVFAAGHRIRLAISTSYWPIVGPGPALVQLLLWPSACGASVPVRTAQPTDGALSPFPAPEVAVCDPTHELEPAVVVSRLGADPETGVVTQTTSIDLDAAGRPARIHYPAID